VSYILYLYIGMRKARLVGDGTSYYHVMSRIIERRFYLGEEEKERFRSMMWRVAEFSGIKILTYSVLDNHFHLLIEVPERQYVDDDELFRRLALIYKRNDVEEVRWRIENYLKKNQPKAAESLRQRFLCRMYDMSEFMKTLKLRFTKWFNRIHERRGTLWEERFKSVLIEGASFVEGEENRHPLHTVAAYIDLNAVRAGLVEDPKDYRWCGYAEAVAGKGVAREGVGFVLGIPVGGMMGWARASKEYRMSLFGGGGKPFSRTRMLQVLRDGGQLSRGELLHCRVRYFSDGMVIGSKAFVDDVFQKRRHLFGAKRKTGARSMFGGSWDGLCSMRDLRCEVIL